MMRWLLLACLLMATPVHAGVIATISEGAPLGETFTTASFNSLGGTGMICHLSWFSNSGALPQPVVTDSASNTWTELTAEAAGATGSRILYDISAFSASATHTLTVTTADFVYPTISCIVVNDAGLTVDVESAGAATAGATSLQPGSLTPSQNTSLIVTGLSCLGTSLMINESFTAVTTDTVGGGHLCGGIAYLYQGTAAAINPTWSWTTSDAAAASSAAFDYTPPATGTRRLLRGVGR